VMPFARRLSILAFVCLAASARAQTQITFADFLGPSDQRVREAFAIPYGKLLIDEFGAILRDSADAACLKEKGIDAAQLPRQSEAILIKYGTAMFETILQNIDHKAFEAAVAKAVPDGKAELERLRADPDVKKVMDLSQPMADAGVVNQVTENIDRVALLAGIKFKRQLSPISTGNQEFLNADPTEKRLDELDKFMQGSKSEALKRYLEMSQAVAEATLAAPGDRLLSMGPLQFMPGLKEELIALCIPAGR
jgi:hypothetical protein